MSDEPQAEQHTTHSHKALVGILIVIIIVLLACFGWYVIMLKQKPMATTTTNTSANCQTSDLKLSLGQPQGTAGTVYMNAVLTNTSAKTCDLQGYPQVTLLDMNGVQLGSAASQNPAFAASTVSLSPGSAAHVAVGFPDAGNFANPSSCSASSAKLKLVPPNANSALEVPLSQKNCPGFSTSAIQPGVQ